jgi:hypothetical protein
LDLPHPHEHPKTRAIREWRTTLLSALVGAEIDAEDPTVDPGWFFDRQHAKWPGRSASPPAGTKSPKTISLAAKHSVS